MIISVVNHTNGQISDEDLQFVVRAINRQITEDFEPYWSLGATLRLEGRSEKKPGKLSLPDLRGDAILYLWSETDVEGALGYHDQNASGIPYGFVFTALSKKLGEPWSVTLSHEAMELIGDPEVNLLVMGPNPKDPNKTVFHWYEMSDAVQNESYEIDGVAVSNFVLPLYFTDNDEVGARNDFPGPQLQRQDARLVRGQSRRLYRLLRSRTQRSHHLQPERRCRRPEAAEDQGRGASRPALHPLQALHRGSGETWQDFTPRGGGRSSGGDGPEAAQVSAATRRAAPSNQWTRP